MEWRDDGVLLSARQHGETTAILEVFTAERGRHLGLVRGATSKKRAAELQPGAQLAVAWRARLEAHLGVFTVEPIRIRAGRLLDDPMALAALSATLALLSAALPEREAQPALYGPTLELLDALGEPERWPGLYAAWELTLLDALGYGLDLSTCAATGSTQDLAYVSPRTGRAVGRAAGAPYAARLLPLPAVLRLGGDARAGEFAAALRTTGHFLARHAPDAFGSETGPPPARRRLQRLAERAAAAAAPDGAASSAAD